VKEIMKWFCKVSGIPTYFLRQNSHEIKMMFVRAYRYTPMFRRRLATVKADLEPSLIFGCGETQNSGWFNIDCFFSSNVDLVMDLRRGLPFDDRSISNCYSEHFLEHLLPVEAASHLADVHRILKRGGIYRVIVPDTGKFMRKYAEGDSEFFSLAHPWEAFPMDAIYSIVNWGGDHRSIYDYDTLERCGIEAGFEQVLISSVNASNTALLNIDRADEHRVAESLYVEMVKAG